MLVEHLPDEPEVLGGARHVGADEPRARVAPQHGPELLDQLVVRDPASDRLMTAMKALDVSRVAIANGALRIEATLTCGSKRATLTSQ